MKTAEEYILENWLDGDRGNSVPDIAKIAYEDAVKEFQSIWKKPEEKPDVGRVVVYWIWTLANAKAGQMYAVETCTINDPEDAGLFECWCYIEDVKKLLPSFATEEK